MWTAVTLAWRSLFTFLPSNSCTRKRLFCWEEITRADGWLSISVSRENVRSNTQNRFTTQPCKSSMPCLSPQFFTSWTKGKETALYLGEATSEQKPLSIWLDFRYFCVHGGLSPELKTLDEIQKVDRFQEPTENTSFFNLLWSDPADSFEREGSSTGGGREADDSRSDH